MVEVRCDEGDDGEQSEGGGRVNEYGSNYRGHVCVIGWFSQ